MARILAVLLMGVAFAVGCQQTPVVTPLPAPNLNRPQIAANAPAARPPVTSQTPPGTARPQAQRQPNVPPDWIPNAPANSWKWIVIHHSATPAGSAAIFDRGHRQKGWDELGYHFVIGNGAGSRDGQIEVGSRWAKQKWGAHAKSPDNQFNDYGIGICLVGNFEMERPSPAQIRSLEKLVAYLSRTYNIPLTRVIGHHETGRATNCPGRYFSIAQIRRDVSQMPHEIHAEEIPATPTRTASRAVPAPPVR